MAEEYSTRLRLDASTHQRLQDIVGKGHYRSSNAAIVDAINRLWDHVCEQELDAAYAAAVAENPSYPYESVAERAAARARRNRRQAVSE
ncbi:antitoxin [Mycobacterium sp. IDR2000157661]|uniref:antitoxin n=1 Tax=Mycobacterium sp. IDR2000157661 TaxID=2867005 RepID=UPI001EEA0F76|nr:antitoxin [Mycobacterium sp. IDR2000157661]ULE31061.1 antitoxin [Mycobacterium sp. IDR2000157661]